MAHISYNRHPIGFFWKAGTFSPQLALRCHLLQYSIEKKSGKLRREAENLLKTRYFVIRIRQCCIHIVFTVTLADCSAAPRRTQELSRRVSGTFEKCFWNFAVRLPNNSSITQTFTIFGKKSLITGDNTYNNRKTPAKHDKTQSYNPGCLRLTLTFDRCQQT